MRAETGIATSILVVTDDHPPDLERYARALLDQRGAGAYEVVLVDIVGQADYARVFDRVAATIANPPPHRILTVPGAGRARGYNAALDAAAPDAGLVIFFADDFIAPASLVAAHREHHAAHPEAEAVGIGAALLPSHLSDDPFAHWLEESGELYGVPFTPTMREVPAAFFYVGNASVKRSFLARAGRFDERFRDHAVDDYELGLRLSSLGMHARYVPDALAEHQHPISLAERCRVMFSAGEAARVIESTHGIPAEWRRTLARHPWHHRWDAWRHRVGHRLSGSPRRRDRSYRSRLRASLCDGYRSAVREIEAGVEVDEGSTRASRG